MCCGPETTVMIRGRRLATVTLIVCSAVGIGACGFPKDDDVKTAFLKENPTFAVTDVGSGEGDGGTVYKHIRYIRPGTTPSVKSCGDTSKPSRHGESSTRVNQAWPERCAKDATGSPAHNGRAAHEMQRT